MLRGSGLAVFARRTRAPGGTRRDHYKNNHQNLEPVSGRISSSSHETKRKKTLGRLVERGAIVPIVLRWAGEDR